MEICMYEGYIRNRSKLCAELGIEASGEREEIERTILLSGYRRWGREVVGHLYGSFALVIRDETRRELFCARDPFGVQSLYYCRTGDGKLCFASTLQPIVDSPGFLKEIDPEALQYYMIFGYPVGERTLYKGVFKLPPGRFLIFRDGQYSIERYYTPDFHPEPEISEVEWTRRIDATLQTILSEDRENFDCSECRSFLSSGVDSSYLLAASGVKNACCIGYSEEMYSEIKNASDTARRLGAQLQELRVTEEEYFTALPDFFRRVEQPLSDASAPVFSIGCGRLASETRLCMSGEGSDEFFAGYYDYPLTDELGQIDGKPYFGCSTVMEAEEARRLLRMAQSCSCESLIKEACGDMSSLDALSRILSVDIALWLEGDILLGVRRAASTNGLHILLPYTDRRMFELSARIPSALKQHGACAKYILRRAASRRLPREIAFRSKIGFSVPIKAWVRDTPRRKEVEELLFGERSAVFFDQALLRPVWETFCGGDDEMFPVIWTVYCFTLWYENVFLKGTVRHARE